MFPLTSDRRQGYSFSLFLFNITVEVLADAVRQEKELKDIQIGKEDIKLFVFLIADDIIFIYAENLKESTNQKKKPFETNE